MENLKNARVGEINLFRPISELINEGSLTKDPTNGDWVLEQAYMGNALDAEQVEFFRRTGNGPCGAITRFKADVDVTQPAASMGYNCQVYFLGQFQYSNTVLAFSIGNYYFNKTTYEGANGTIRIGTTVEKLKTDGIVYSDIYGKVRGKLPKQVEEKLQELENLGITKGCYNF